LRDLIQDVVACVAHARVRRIDGGHVTSAGLGLALGSGDPIRLQSGGAIHLAARLRFVLASAADDPRQWRATIVAYQYTLLDADQREILAFHHHPDGQSHVTTPHLHLGDGAGQLRADLAAAHVPTGPITLTAVVRLAIEGFTASPLRRDWDRTLHRCEAILSGQEPPVRR